MINLFCLFTIEEKIQIIRTISLSFIFACRLMISNYFIIGGASILLGIIGIQTTIYWFFFLIAFLLGFVGNFVFEVL